MPGGHVNITFNVIQEVATLKGGASGVGAPSA